MSKSKNPDARTAMAAISLQSGTQMSSRRTAEAGELRGQEAWARPEKSSAIVEQSGTAESSTRTSKRDVESDAMSALKDAFAGELKRRDSLHKAELDQMRLEFAFRQQQSDEANKELREREEANTQLTIENAVLKEKLRRSPIEEILSSACLTFGSTGVGFGSSLLAVTGAGEYGLYCVACSGALVAIGVLYRWFK